MSATRLRDFFESWLAYVWSVIVNEVSKSVSWGLQHATPGDISEQRGAHKASAPCFRKLSTIPTVHLQVPKAMEACIRVRLEQGQLNPLQGRLQEEIGNTHV